MEFLHSYEHGHKYSTVEYGVCIYTQKASANSMRKESMSVEWYFFHSFLRFSLSEIEMRCAFRLVFNTFIRLPVCCWRNV